MKKEKIIVISILSIIAITSSYAILRDDDYFSKNEMNNKLLATESSMNTSVAFANETTQTAKPQIAKTTTTTATVKKATPKKKTATKKKVVKKKKSINFAPPIITPDTAPHSPKTRYN